MPSKINLVISGGPLSGTRYGFDYEMTCTIGRSEECDICIPKEHAVGISKKHCLLSIKPPDIVTLRDLGSSNGTYINDINICDPEQKKKLNKRFIDDSDEIQLRHNDEIIIGEIFFTILINNNIYCTKCSNPIDPSTLDSDYDPKTVMCSECYKIQFKGIQNTSSMPIAAPPMSGTNTLRKIARIEKLKESQLFIENFNIQRLIGKGSMGMVYLAENLKNGNLEALKLLIPQKAFEDDTKDQFLREVEFLSLLEHPNIVKIFDSGIAQGTFYFTMEYCETGSIEQVVKGNEDPMDIDDALKIILQCINALDYAHSQGIVHRDIKPENIFLKDMGRNSYTVKMGDFGVAKALEIAGFSSTTEEFIFGTLDFISRQQVSEYQNVQPEWDIWSLTATLYYMLTKHPPRALDPHDTVNSVLKIFTTPIKTYNSDIPKKLARFIDNVLRDDRELVIKTAKQFRSALIDVM